VELKGRFALLAVRGLRLLVVHGLDVRGWRLQVVRVEDYWLFVVKDLTAVKMRFVVGG
jgi:hypothetical protein